MKIFITGATGYIGQHLALRLANDGHEIHALVRSPEKAHLIQHPNIKIFKGDIQDIDSVIAAMQGCRQVYHVAAYAAINPDTKVYFKMNVAGTQHILNAALSCGVNRIVFTSTAGVIGPSGEHPGSEYQWRMVPFFNEYESSKFIAEEMALRYCHNGLDIVIVNPTRVYGPGYDSVSNAVTRYIRLYIKGIGRFLPGSGKKLGNYAYVHDVVEGHILAMEKGKTGERYILGGENVSYRKLFGMVGELCGRRIWQIEISGRLLIAFVGIMSFLYRIVGASPPLTPEWTRKYLYDWALSCQKAENELGYRITPLQQGLNETIAWIKQNPQK
ncbi:MAG: SDR family oxidoreductase [Cyclobacteriaceae bacterium]|nr:SDR family oxidoreductase [Cyclobacteriaceae bacterium]